MTKISCQQKANLMIGFGLNFNLLIYSLKMPSKLSGKGLVWDVEGFKFNSLYIYIYIYIYIYSFYKSFQCHSKFFSLTVCEY